MMSVSNWFYKQVQNKGPWDYKQLDRKYEDFGNFHYGAAGASVGFSRNTLERMAGWAQGVADTGSTDPSFGESGFLIFFGGRRPYGDDPRDNQQIRRGFAFGENYNDCQEETNRSFWSDLPSLKSF